MKRKILVDAVNAVHDAGLTAVVDVIDDALVISAMPIVIDRMTRRVASIVVDLDGFGCPDELGGFVYRCTRHQKAADDMDMSPALWTAAEDGPHMDEEYV